MASRLEAYMDTSFEGILEQLQHLRGGDEANDEDKVLPIPLFFYDMSYLEGTVCGDGETSGEDSAKEEAAEEDAPEEDAPAEDAPKEDTHAEDSPGKDADAPEQSPSASPDHSPSAAETLSERVHSLVKASFDITSIDDFTLAFIYDDNDDFAELVATAVTAVLYERRIDQGGRNWPPGHPQRERALVRRLNIEEAYSENFSISQSGFPQQACSQQVVLVLINRSKNSIVPDSAVEWQQLSRNVDTSGLPLSWPEYIEQTHEDPFCNPFRVVSTFKKNSTLYAAKQKKVADFWADYTIPLAVYQHILVNFSVANDNVVFFSRHGPCMPLLASFFDMVPFTT